MMSALAPGGVVIEGTCDELGRLATWVLLDAGGPVSLTLAARMSTLDRPATLAERLPKALIHHNVPGSRFTRCSPHSTTRGLRPLRSACSAPDNDGSGRSKPSARPVAGARSTPAWRRGELTVPWSSVVP